MEIKFVPREEIDKTKWNSCVHYATNGNIFGYMWYLDHIAKDWDALVEGDYESVFPLVWRLGRFSGQELHQPALIRELGIYSIHVLSKPRIERFLEAIPEQYKHISINLNEQNPVTENSAFKVKEQTNYQLFLNRPYEEIANAYSRPLMEQLQRAEDEGLVLTSSMKPEQIAAFYQENHPRELQSEEVFHGMQRVMYNALHRGWGFTSVALDTQANPLAVNFFLYSHGKVVSFMPLESPEGKKARALAHLFNGLIRQHAGRPVILDFNVGQKDALAIDFGAQANPFYQIQLNKRTFHWF
ncbi:MAG: hypothetical protein RIC19_22450 [Phaeodactylibacter sp.]|uniref:hypothetical protein n=1 Tax=Phaeodactylibacter sp. TaxID=1940289 RepID=UPI0032EC4832